MSTLFEKIETNTGKVKIELPQAATAIHFSNSSSPPKWFALTVAQISRSLENIAANIAEFRGHNAGTYDETRLRNLFVRYLEDPVARALAGTQTLPVYTVIGRIIHYANSNDDYPEKTLRLDEGEIRNAISQLDENSTALMKAAVGAGNRPKPKGERVRGGENVLYYGAPGTGKSFSAKAEGIKARAEIFRTVFHPDLQNSDFIGSLRPHVDDEKKVTYEFRPGPFSRALLFARDNPTVRVHLVIEELNRAMAAAVFGDVFQLLDRDTDGTSEYTVDAPSDDFAKWFGEDSFGLPSNLWILATMNSADQGVYPLDTAFRRRWRQTYIPIDYEKSPDGTLDVGVEGGATISISWKSFVKHLNDFLISELDIPEDRLIGPRYLSGKELRSGQLPGKLLIYLWDDLLRHHGRHRLFLKSVRTYGALDRAVLDGGQVFNSEFVAGLSLSAIADRAD